MSRPSGVSLSRLQSLQKIYLEQPLKLKTLEGYLHNNSLEKKMRKKLKLSTLLHSSIHNLNHSLTLKLKNGLLKTNGSEKTKP